MTASHTAATDTGATTGRIEGIFITATAGAPMTPLPSAHAIAGSGLEGDRYANGVGFYSDGNDGRQLTLIEQEDLDQLARSGVTLEPHECRRNLVTSGIDLKALIGQHFRIGDVECEGIRLCPPCNRLEDLTRPGPLRGLARSGGIRAHILSSGQIAVGNAIYPVAVDEFA